MISANAEMWHPSKAQWIAIYVIVLFGAGLAGIDDWLDLMILVPAGVLLVAMMQGRWERKK